MTTWCCDITKEESPLAHKTFEHPNWCPLSPDYVPAFKEYYKSIDEEWYNKKKYKISKLPARVLWKGDVLVSKKNQRWLVVGREVDDALIWVNLKNIDVSYDNYKYGCFDKEEEVSMIIKPSGLKTKTLRRAYPARPASHLLIEALTLNEKLPERVESWEKAYSNPRKISSK